MALKGFGSLTSARHLEYFKIPLSKKKYLCNQKCGELKTNKQTTPKTPNKTLPQSHPPFVWRTISLLLSNVFATKPHQVPLPMASGFQIHIHFLPCASPSKAISSFSVSSPPVSVAPGYNSLLPGVLLQFPSCPA